MKTAKKYKTYLLQIEQQQFEQIKQAAKDKGLTIKSFLLQHYIKP
jgi:uncharacterized protein (DUF1778 family)